MTARTVREKHFELNVPYRTPCPVSQGGAIDVRSYVGSNGAAGAKTGRGSAHEMPRWVKMFGVVAAFAVMAFAVLHLTGGGMGHLAHGLTHGEMGADGVPTEHGHYEP